MLFFLCVISIFLGGGSSAFAEDDSNIKRAFLEAMKESNLEKMTELIQVGVDVNDCMMKEEDCIPFVMWAIELDDNDSLNLLLKAGASPEKGSKGITPLMLSIFSTQQSHFTSVLKYGANINHQDEQRGYTPIMLAAMFGRFQFFIQLYRMGADTEISSKKGETALSLALSRGHTNIYQFLKSPQKWMEKQNRMLSEAVLHNDYWEMQSNLMNGADPNITVQNMYPLQHVFTKPSFQKHADLLLNFGADVNLVGNTQQKNQSILSSQITSNNLEAVRWLVRHGADPDGSPKEDQLPLVHAIEFSDVQTTQMLLEQGANPNRFQSQATPFEYAIISQNEEIIMLMLRYKATFDSMDLQRVHQLGKLKNVDSLRALERLRPLLSSQYDLTDELIKGIEERNEERWKKALDAGASINGLGNGHWTPLHYAAREGNRDLLDILLARGAQINIETTDQWTPLMLAARNDQLEILRTLLQKGADLSLKNTEGETALDIAVKHNQRYVALFLKNPDSFERLQKNKKLIESFSEKSSEGILTLNSTLSLLKQGADIDWATDDGWQAIHFAARENNTVLMEFLLEKNATTNIVTANGWSPLHLAAYNGHVDICHQLLQAGADKDLKNDENKTAKKIAQENQHPFVVDLLDNPENYKQIQSNRTLLSASEESDEYKAHRAIVDGADVNVQNPWGWSPIHFAVRENNRILLDELIEKGADIHRSITIDEGTKSSALILAALNGYLEASESLLKAGADPYQEYDSNISAFTVAQRNGQQHIVSLFEDLSRYQELMDSSNMFQLIEERIKALTNANAGKEYKESILFQIEENLIKRVPVDIQNNFRWQPLQIAARDNDAELVALFLKYGADPNTIVESTEGKDTALTLAARNGNLEVVHHLLEKGAKFNIPKVPSAIAIAKEQSHDDVVQIIQNPESYQKIKASRDLLQLSVDIKSSFDNEQIPQWKEQILELIALGADLKIQNNDGFRPLDYILLAETDVSELVPLLVYPGYKDHTVSSRNKNEEIELLSPSMLIALSSGSLSMMERLLEIGFVPQKTTSQGIHSVDWVKDRNEYLLAALMEHPDQLDHIKRMHELHEALHDFDSSRAFRSIVSNPFIDIPLSYSIGSKAKETDKNGNIIDIIRFPSKFKGLTALQICAQMRQFTLVEALLKAGANPNLGTEKEPRTPLMLAIDSGDESIVQLFMRFGGNPDHKNTLGFTSYHYMNQAKQFQILNILQQKETPFHEHDRLIDTIIAQDYQRFQLQLQNTKDINAIGKNGLSPLHWASKLGDLTIIHALLDEGAEIDIRTSSGQSPLMLAAQTNLESVRCLLKNGANPEFMDEAKKTAQDYAANDMIREIINIGEKNIEENVRIDKIRSDIAQQKSPDSLDDLNDEILNDLLYRAVENGNIEAIDLLLQAEASPTAKIKDEASPLERAVQIGHPKIVEKLLRKSKLKKENRTALLDEASTDPHFEILGLLVPHNQRISDEQRKTIQKNWGPRFCFSDPNTSIPTSSDIIGLWKQCDSLFQKENPQKPKLMLVSGHQDTVTAIASSINNEWFVTGDENGQVYIWDADAQKITKTLSLQQEIKQLAISNDNRWLYIATTNTIYVWDCHHRRMQWKKEIPVNAAFFDPHSNLWLATESKIQKWNVAYGYRQLQWESGEITSLLFNGTSLIAGDKKGRISYWNLHGHLLRRWQAHRAEILTIGVHEDKIFSVASMKNINKIRQETYRVHLWNDQHLLSTHTTAQPAQSNIIWSTQGELIENIGPVLEVRSLSQNNIQRLQTEGVPSYKNGGPITYLGDKLVYAVGNDLYIRDQKTEKLGSLLVNVRDFCSPAENTIAFDTTWRDISERNIPIIKGMEQNVCTKGNYFIRHINSEIQVYAKKDDSLLYRFSGAKNIRDAKFNSSEDVLSILVDTFSPSKSYVHAQEVWLIDLKTGIITARFHPFQKGWTTTPSTLEFSSDGRWLIIRNAMEIISYDIEKKRIHKRRDTITDKELNYIKDSAIRENQIWSLGAQLQVLSIPELTLIQKNELSGQKILHMSNTTFVASENTLYRIDEEPSSKSFFGSVHDARIKDIVRLNDSIFMTSSDDGTIIFWDIKVGYLARIVFYENGGWAILHKSGLFDASLNALEQLYFVVDNQIIALEQLKSRYFEPGLLQKVLGYNKQEPLRSIEQLGNVSLFPKVQITPKNEIGSFIIHLMDQGGGIGSVHVWLNGKEVILNESNSSSIREVKNARTTQTIEVNLENHSYIRAKENELRVVAFNDDGYLSSRSIELEFSSKNKSPESQPNLFLISIGSSDYQGTQIDLHFAAKDADDINHALRLGSKRLFGTDKTYSWMLSTTQKERTQWPTKENIVRVFQEVAKQAQPQDILVVYFSGHGMSLPLGESTSEYFYLTADAYSKNKEDYKDSGMRQAATISSAELVTLINASAALKQVMILDTCSSGQVVDNLTNKRHISSGTIRALEQVQSRTGMHIIAGSTADSVSYEANQYGQGLLTYSILEGLKGAGLKENRFIDVVQLFQNARDRVPSLAADIGGIQQPVVLSRSDSFYIGELSDSEKKMIPLAEPRPIFIHSTFMNQETYADEYDLGTQVDEAFRDLSHKIDSPLVFVDTRQYPNGWRLRGLYTTKEGEIHVEAGIFFGDQKIHEINVLGRKDSIQKIIEEMVEMTLLETQKK